MNKIKKFVTVKTLADIEIKSDIGYVPIKNIMKTVEYQVYQVIFTDGTIVKCADNHIFIDGKYKEVFAAELETGQILYDNKVVESVTALDDKESMYDLQMEYHNRYYTNGVLSHNTTVVAAYICHQMIFNEEYTTAVLANKGSTSREILSRIKLMYEELPWWLQMGITIWNKGDIELGNRSKVLSAAASSSSIRGKSINCVDVSTQVTVKNKKTNKMETISIAELESRLVRAK